MSDFAIGIDLGTTNTCVAVVKQNHQNYERVDVLENYDGHRLTPSVVAFTEDERIVGDLANRHFTFNPENTVKDVKRLIGRRMYEDSVRKQIQQKCWNFKVSEDTNSENPLITVQYKAETMTFLPEQISAMILSDIKKTADRKLNCDVTKAVITVPAYFNNSQRQATIDAGKIAGLEVLGIINEPTAAAIAYGFDKRDDKEQNILVYDFGGGTLDVAIIVFENNACIVKAVSGNMDLGGRDFDLRLVDHFIQEHQRKHGENTTEDIRAKLLEECESVKRSLSSRLRCNVVTEKIKSKITREKFEVICSDLIEKAAQPISETLKIAQMDKADIDTVILAGGSTRIPAIEKMVSEYFDGKPLNYEINRDEAVAHGAAIHAANLNGDEGIREINLMDVTPFDIGIQVEVVKFSCIIPRNTKIPVDDSHRCYTTFTHNQKTAKLKILEKDLSGRLNPLGEIVLKDIQDAPKGVPEINVKLCINRSGVLTVHAEDLRAGCNESLEIDFFNGRLSADDIEEKRKQEQKFHLSDI